MGKLEARQRWVQRIIDERCKGVQADFAKRISKSDSYVSRMLYPRGKKGAKGIGEDMVEMIIQAFGESIGRPEGEERATSPRPQGTGGKAVNVEAQDANDVLALQMAFQSLASALAEHAPAAAVAFAAHLEEMAKEQHFSLRRGVVAEIVRIVREDRQKVAAARRGS